MKTITNRKILKNEKQPLKDNRFFLEENDKI